MTPVQLEGLEANTWVIGMAVVAVMLVAAVIAAYSIKGAPEARPQVARRNWFVILGLAGPVVYYCLRLNQAVEIVNTAFKWDFRDTCIWVLGVSVVGYFVVGLLLAAIIRHTPFGSILKK